MIKYIALIKANIGYITRWTYKPGMVWTIHICW